MHSARDGNFLPLSGILAKMSAAPAKQLYDLAFKLWVMEYAELSSKLKAAKTFKVHRRRVQES